MIVSSSKKILVFLLNRFINLHKLYFYMFFFIFFYNKNFKQNSKNKNFKLCLKHIKYKNIYKYIFLNIIFIYQKKFMQK